MNRILLLVALAVVAWTTAPARADGAAGSAAASPPGSPFVAPGLPLHVWNREIVVFRGILAGATPEERVKRAQERFARLPHSIGETRVQARPASLGNVSGAVVMAGDTILFAVMPQDADVMHGESVEDVAQRAAKRAQEAIDARFAQRNPRELLIGAGLSAGASVGFVVLVWLLARLRTVLLRGIRTVHGRHLQPLWGPEVGRHLLSLEKGAIHLLFWTFGLLLAYLWLSFVLTRFPYTAPWGNQLGAYFAHMSSQLALGALRALPGLFTVLVILLAARFLARVVSAFAASVEGGRIQVSWLNPESVEATRRVAVVLIWLFAITVAYPYIPGSDTAAFQGVSVFAGLMITLGSAGFIGHLMAGLLVVYSRALRAGEMVKVGDTFGVVTEVGTLSTKVTTLSLEQVTIPNAVLMSSTVTNYSRLAGEGGAILSTKVTIGYDTPWRQVHALLLLAAERTDAVRKEPKPFVLQTALSDFYVEYELRVHLDGPENRFTILSDLHAQIQDAFNEYGVQIMSPHFMLQPDGTVVVKRDQWNAAPASPASAPIVQAPGAGPAR